jgi:hypothetical protein
MSIKAKGENPLLNKPSHKISEESPDSISTSIVSPSKIAYYSFSIVFSTHRDSCCGATRACSNVLKSSVRSTSKGLYLHKERKLIAIQSPEIFLIGS